MNKKFLGVLCALFFLFAAKQVSAHAVVSPNQANVGAFTNFSLGVPSEKPIATVGVKLMLPDGLNYVTPFVKPGWKIEVKKDGDKVTEIDWTGGTIPAEEKDQFMFSVQVPTTATTLDWKVYQTYSDGSVVSWDQDPNAQQPTDSSGKMDFSKIGPYSTTKVVNDLEPANNSATTPAAPDNSAKSNWALGLSIVAVLLGLWALVKRPGSAD